ncbi:O-antigen ligase family protein [Bizionia sp. KMM 8389]
MNNLVKSWESGFWVVSLLVLVAVPFGYFVGSLAFVIWVIYSGFWIVKTKNFKVNKALYPFLLFSLMAFLSLLWSQDHRSTLHGIGRQLPLFLFAIVGLFLPKISKQKLQQTLNVFAVFLSVLAVVLFTIAAFKYQKYQYLGFLYYHELVSPLDLNAIYVSYMVSVVFLFVFKNLSKKSLWMLPILAILFAFLVLLSSKMLLVITVLLSVIIAFFKIKSKTIRLVSLVGIASVTLGVLLFVKPVQDRFTKELETSYVDIFTKDSFKKGRVYTGLEARLLQVRVFKNIINTPVEVVLGVGLDASEKEIQSIHTKLNTPEVFQKYNFHNQYIQVFAEYGFIGFILLVLVLIIGVKKSFKINVLFPFIVVTIALFFTESVIWRQRGIMFFGIMYIFLMLTSNSNESKEQISEV